MILFTIYKFVDPALRNIYFLYTFLDCSNELFSLFEGVGLLEIQAFYFLFFL